jgi:hypothetical protein
MTARFHRYIGTDSAFNSDSNNKLIMYCDDDLLTKRLLLYLIELNINKLSMVVVVFDFLLPYRREGDLK